MPEGDLEGAVIEALSGLRNWLLAVVGCLLLGCILGCLLGAGEFPSATLLLMIPAELVFGLAMFPWGPIAAVSTLLALWLPLRLELERGRLYLLAAELVSVTLFFADVTDPPARL